MNFSGESLDVLNEKSKEDMDNRDSEQKMATAVKRKSELGDPVNLEESGGAHLEDVARKKSKTDLIGLEVKQIESCVRSSSDPENLTLQDSCDVESHSSIVGNVISGLVADVEIKTEITGAAEHQSSSQSSTADDKSLVVFEQDEGLYVLLTSSQQTEVLDETDSLLEIVSAHFETKPLDLNSKPSNEDLDKMNSLAEIVSAQACETKSSHSNLKHVQNEDSDQTNSLAESVSLQASETEPLHVNLKPPQNEDSDQTNPSAESLSSQVSETKSLHVNLKPLQNEDSDQINSLAESVSSQASETEPLHVNLKPPQNEDSDQTNSSAESLSSQASETKSLHVNLKPLQNEDSNKMDSLSNSVFTQAGEIESFHLSGSVCGTFSETAGCQASTSKSQVSDKFYRIRITTELASTLRRPLLGSDLIKISSLQLNCLRGYLCGRGRKKKPKPYFLQIKSGQRNLKFRLKRRHVIEMLKQLNLPEDKCFWSSGWTKVSSSSNIPAVNSAVQNFEFMETNFVQQEVFSSVAEMTFAKPMANANSATTPLQPENSEISEVSEIPEKVFLIKITDELSSQLMPPLSASKLADSLLDLVEIPCSDLELLRKYLHRNGAKEYPKPFFYKVKIGDEEQKLKLYPKHVFQILKQLDLEEDEFVLTVWKDKKLNPEFDNLSQNSGLATDLDQSIDDLLLGNSDMQPLQTISEPVEQNDIKVAGTNLVPTIPQLEDGSVIVTEANCREAPMLDLFRIPVSKKMFEKRLRSSLSRELTILDISSVDLKALVGYLCQNAAKKHPKPLHFVTNYEQKDLELVLNPERVLLMLKKLELTVQKFDAASKMNTVVKNAVSTQPGNAPSCTAETSFQTISKPTQSDKVLNAKTLPWVEDSSVDISHDQEKPFRLQITRKLRKRLRPPLSRRPFGVDLPNFVAISSADLEKLTRYLCENAAEEYPEPFYFRVKRGQIDQSFELYPPHVIQFYEQIFLMNDKKVLKVTKSTSSHVVQNTEFKEDSILQEDVLQSGAITEPFLTVSEHLPNVCNKGNSNEVTASPLQGSKCVMNSETSVSDSQVSEKPFRIVLTKPLAPICSVDACFNFLDVPSADLEAMTKYLCQNGGERCPKPFYFKAKRGQIDQTYELYPPNIISLLKQLKILTVQKFQKASKNPIVIQSSRITDTSLQSRNSVSLTHEMESCQAVSKRMQPNEILNPTDLNEITPSDSNCAALIPESSSHKAPISDCQVSENPFSIKIKKKLSWLKPLLLQEPFGIESASSTLVAPRLSLASSDLEELTKYLCRNGAEEYPEPFYYRAKSGQSNLEFELYPTHVLSMLKQLVFTNNVIKKTKVARVPHYLAKIVFCPAPVSSDQSPRGNFCVRVPEELSRKLCPLLDASQSTIDALKSQPNFFEISREGVETMKKYVSANRTKRNPNYFRLCFKKGGTKKTKKIGLSREGIVQILGQLDIEKSTGEMSDGMSREKNDSIDNGFTTADISHVSSADVLRGKNEFLPCAAEPFRSVRLLNDNEPEKYVRIKLNDILSKRIKPLFGRPSPTKSAVNANPAYVVLCPADLEWMYKFAHEAKTKKPKFWKLTRGQEQYEMSLSQFHVRIMLGMLYEETSP